MANPELRAGFGEANFRLDSGAVPALSIEDFKPHVDTEEKDIVRASINAVQGKKRISQLKAHFKLNLHQQGDE